MDDKTQDDVTGLNKYLAQSNAPELHYVDFQYGAAAEQALERWPLLRRVMLELFAEEAPTESPAEIPAPRG